MNEDKTQALRERYAKQSKHSNYQILPTAVAKLLDQDSLSTTSRHERERLTFIVEHVDVAGKTVLDIGGNTGFFVFELLDGGASHVTLYEGTAEHAEFVEMAAEALGRSGDITVAAEYFQFIERDSDEKYDVALLLNVLHHVGDDYGDQDYSVEDAKQRIVQELRAMSDVADVVVFQLGFNWQGDPTKPLFAGGTKQEMIDFVERAAEGVFEVIATGIATRSSDGLTYAEPDATNILRDDSLGEFLNRPMFILRKK